MSRQKILVLPGSSGRNGSDRYEQVYATIEREAGRRDYDCRVISYPGQGGKMSGLLNYSSALATTLMACHEFNPDRLIGRSFGCVVAAGALGSEDEWVNKCKEAILWGPGFRATLDRLFSTTEKKLEAIKGFADYDTFLSPDYFDTLPSIENLIGIAKCNLRIARGSGDKYNTKDDLNYLAAVHHRMQPGYSREVVEVSGLIHEVIQAEVSSEELLARYFGCLFDPIIVNT